MGGESWSINDDGDDDDDNYRLRTVVSGVGSPSFKAMSEARTALEWKLKARRTATGCGGAGAGGGAQFILIQGIEESTGTILLATGQLITRFEESGAVSFHGMAYDPRNPAAHLLTAAPANLSASYLFWVDRPRCLQYSCTLDSICVHVADNASR